ncbi:MAG: hypothetical protein Q9187_007668, partial [Circinaria calcarea]
ENLKGIYSARAFVGWYNGLPEYSDLAPDLSTGEEAVVIGQGNVALDVARTLLSGVGRLKSTDITEQALAALSKSKVKRVRVIGRRGPLQASFTIKEVRELMTLPNVGFESIDRRLLPPELAKLPRAQKRLMQLLSKGSLTSMTEAKKSWSLKFFLSPTSFNCPNDVSAQLSSVTCAKNALQGSNPSDPAAKVSMTDENIILPASLAFRSIGYKSQAIPGMQDNGIAFDEKSGTIPNDPYGRIISNSLDPDGLMAIHIPGMYCTGWVKRGPTGVIATTMEDAFATAEAIAYDWEHQVPFLNSKDDFNIEKRGWTALKGQVEAKGIRRVSWSDWQKIDSAEKERGARRGKEREKFTSVKEMLERRDMTLLERNESNFQSWHFNASLLPHEHTSKPDTKLPSEPPTPQPKIPPKMPQIPATPRVTIPHQHPHPHRPLNSQSRNSHRRNRHSRPPI